MLRTKKQIKQKRWLRKLARAHVLITALSLSVYFLVAFFDPGFLSYDLRQKFHALADDIVITATVLDPPVQPIVTAVSECSPAGVLSVELDWADDVNSYSYDITRDALPLVSGLAPSGYSDTVVSLATTYVYVVTANGPMGPGFAVSDPVSVTTLSECEATAVAPAVSLTAFSGRSIASYNGTPRVFDRRPLLTGTTNMPSAIIQIAVGPPSSLTASLAANINGYFEWAPPTNLSFGTQTLSVTAIDPGDPLRTISTSLLFEVKKRDTGNGGSSKRSPGASVPSNQLEEGVAPSADFTLTVKNRDKKVFQGEALDVALGVKNISSEFERTPSTIRFSILDALGNKIASEDMEALLSRGAEIQKFLTLPLYADPGQYYVQAEVLLGKNIMSRSDIFTILETPLISLGGTAFITFAEIAHNLGWITLTLLTLLLLWSHMFLREYSFYLHALRHITEQHLKNAGFLTKRKGGS